MINAPGSAALSKCNISPSCWSKLNTCTISQHLSHAFVIALLFGPISYFSRSYGFRFFTIVCHESTCCAWKVPMLVFAIFNWSHNSLCAFFVWTSRNRGSVFNLVAIAISIFTANIIYWFNFIYLYLGYFYKNGVLCSRCPNSIFRRFGYMFWGFNISMFQNFNMKHTMPTEHPFQVCNSLIWTYHMTHTILDKTYNLPKVVSHRSLVLVQDHDWIALPNVFWLRDI